MAKLQKTKIPFTQVANEVLNDDKISWKAKGLFAYLFSKPDGWDFSGKRIAHDSPDGLDSVYKGLKELEDARYLMRQKHQNGRISYNLEFSRCPWIDSPVRENPKQGKSQLGKIATISNTDSESNKDEKEIIQSATETVAGINEIIPLFESINPAYKKFYSNRTQRSAISRLLVQWPRPKLDNIIRILPQTNQDKYAPTITTPLQLEDSMGKLIAFIQKNRKQNNVML